ncbi:Muscle M-line assembly protein unc-89 [Rhizoctonia solani]|uniref:Muscle M-line assembly protein unc-89 n=1 Tax=Rhizoctonia solani TaxID=456999 RepID=A0A0K6FZS2_9AGAM|nr:Muscle M-line assembly protein unc-89 [Rhizoctonia solani]
MAHSSSMGKYGILHIVNRKNNSPAYSYPVDSEETTFGRNDDCDIRLLYGWVSGLHCKLFFQNAKAFLTVYGLNGVIVDGCHIGRNPDADDESSETTIPIMNNSQIELYRKRFIFEYPSKELRIKAMAEPMTVRPKRTLRLSMIQSAQVFTPSKPTADASTPKHRRRRSETLAEQLQSPIKPFSPARPTPLSNMGHETLTADDEEREVTLVGPGGAQSVVVLEEEKDLVVVEAIGDESDDEGFSDDEEIIMDKENENPFDIGRSPAYQNGKTASPAPAVQRSFSTGTPQGSSYTPKRPNLHRNAASAPAQTPSPAPAANPQPARTPARKARFSLHKAVLLRSAQRQLVERERLNQLQVREPTIFDEDADIDMSDMEPDFVDEPESDPNLMVGDANIDVRLASNVDRLTVQDPDADEEDAVESDHAMGQPSDQSVSEGDVSVESDISEVTEDQEQPSTAIGSRIRNSLSAIGNFLPNLLGNSAQGALGEDAEEVDIVDQRSDASRVKAEPEEEPLHFSDSEDEEDDEEDEDALATGDHAPFESDSSPVHAWEPAEPAVKVEETPVQPRRLNAFMTPQASRSNFGRVPVGRKSVAHGAETGETTDMSWLPSRVPVSTQEIHSEEEEEESHDLPDEFVDEEIPVALSDLKQMPELDDEEKAARRQSALAVLAAGPRQLSTRRQSVAPQLVKSEPIDPNDRRMTLAGATLDAPAGTPQHAATLAKPSDYQIAIDSSDEEDEPPAESALDTLRKKVDYMRRQSMSRAAREKPIGPLFEGNVSSDVKLEDSEELFVTTEAEDIKQELEEAEQELEELEDEAETEAELSVDDGEGEHITDADDVSESETSETEQDDAQEQSDIELEQKVMDERAEDEVIPDDAKIQVVLPTGPSTPALKGIRALFRAEEVKGLGTQTPAGLDGMIQLFGPEAELEAELAVQDKPSRLRTKSADPAPSKIATATMSRAKSSQAAVSSKAPEVARTRSADTRVKTDAAKSTSRIATRTLREPSKLPRVHTPTEEPEAAQTKAPTRKAVPATTVSAALPRRTRAVKAEPEELKEEEPAPAASKLKAPTRRVTRTASAASHASMDDKPATRKGRTAAAEPAARTTRAKAAAPTRRVVSASARPTTPTAESVDENDPMDSIPMPESPTKRSTRAKAPVVKSEPEDDEPAPSTRSRTRTAESDTSKGKRTAIKRAAPKDTDDNKENTAVDLQEPEVETKAKASGLPTKTRKVAPTTTSKLPAPTKTASKSEPATTSTTRALRTRARK